jgi:DNA-binding transcriptional MerR regulator
MMNKELTISELEERSGVSRRTIHFYVKEGVLPPPAGRGGGARYNEEHLVQLSVIRDLQRSHLKLSGIKEALEDMSFAVMKKYLKDNDVEASRWHVETSFKKFYPKPEIQEGMIPIIREKSSGRTLENKNYSFLDLGAKEATSETRKKKNAPLDMIHKRNRTSVVKKETWEHIKVGDGVELKIRQDITGIDDKTIEQILREIRKKLK